MHPIIFSLLLLLLPVFAYAAEWKKQSPSTIYTNQEFGTPGYFAPSDIFGNLQPPSPSVRGGTLSATAPSNQFQTGVSTTGAPVFAQPSFNNLTGMAIPAQLPATTTNALGAVQIGTGLSVSSGIVSMPSVNGTPGAFNNITVDAQGRITAVRGFNSGDITGALGFTPIAPSAIGTTVAPLSGGVVPPDNLPAATTGTQGAMSLTTAAAQAPVQSVGGNAGAVTNSQLSASVAAALGYTPPNIGTAAGTARDAAAAITAETNAQTTANAACPKAGCTMTGQLYATVVRLGSGNITWAGAGSNANSLLWASNAESGSGYGGNLNFAQMQLTDTVNFGSSTANAFYVYDSITSPASGGRVAIAGTSQFNGAGPIVGPTIGTLGQATMAASAATRVTRGWPYNIAPPLNSKGGSLGLWGLPSFNTTANGFQGEQGAELDNSIAPSMAQPPQFEFGLSVENITTAVGPQAVYDDMGIQLGAIGHNYLCGFCAGSSTYPWPMAPSGTILGAEPTAYGSTSTPSALYGVDFRSVVGTSGGDAMALPSFAVDWSGNLDATSLTTNGTLQAETATLTGVTINTVTRGSFTNTGGIYATWPTFTVQTPPSGTTATATATTLAGNSILAFGSTGTGYTAGDQLTLVGGTGTAAVLNVLTVDGNGRILTYSKTSNGAYSAVPYSPISVTGGTGTGATFEMDWASSSGVYALSGAGQFASTGAGYAVGDVVSPSGDTGTEPTYTVTAVTSTGGIMQPLTPTTGGAITAMASGTYHAMAGGTGTGASLQVGWGVSAFSVTGGSGYPAFPPPLIVGSSTNWYNAQLVAQMTPVAATLAIQGNGGPTTVGGTLGVSGSITVSGGSNGVSAGVFQPTSSVLHSVGVYLPGSNEMGFSTSGVRAGIIDPNQHWYIGNTSSPTATTCGTSPSIVRGNDQMFTVLIGSGTVTSCLITFSGPFTVTPNGATISPANSVAAVTGTTGEYSAPSDLNTTTLTIHGTALAGAEYTVHVQ